MAPTHDEILKLKGRPLGRVLVRMGAATHEQIHQALDVQVRSGGLIGEILVSLDYIDRSALDTALAYQAGVTPPSPHAAQASDDNPLRK